MNKIILLLIPIITLVTIGSIKSKEVNYYSDYNNTFTDSSSIKTHTVKYDEAEIFIYNDTIKRWEEKHNIIENIYVEYNNDSLNNLRIYIQNTHVMDFSIIKITQLKQKSYISYSIKDSLDIKYIVSLTEDYFSITQGNTNYKFIKK